MIGKEYLLELLKKSNNIIITYASDSIIDIEYILYEINAHIINSCVDESFNIDSYMRNSKLNFLLDNKEFRFDNHLVLNVERIYPDDFNIASTLGTKNGLKNIFISNILDNFYLEARDRDIKTIILSPYVNLMGNEYGITSKIKKSLYNSDLFLCIKGNKVEIVKDRYGNGIKHFQLN